MSYGVLKYFLFVFLFGLQLFADGSHPNSLLKTLEHTYYHIDRNDKKRVGSEIEYQNLSLDQAVAISLTMFGGTVENAKSKEGTDIRILKNTAIGDFKIKVETNQTGEKVTPQSEWVYEIVGPPLDYNGSLKLQALLDAFKKAGATGTNNGTELGAPVSIQTNVEADFIERSDGSKKVDLRFEFLVMRNFYINYNQIMKELSPIDSRIKYILPCSPGMLEKFLDPNYQPHEKQMLDDYIYRQSLELMGNKDAWKMHIHEVKKIIRKNYYPIIRQVAKLNAFRFTSLLFYNFPEDAYLKKYSSRTWIVPAPITEGRASNNDWDLITRIKEAVGLRNASRVHGLFKFNKDDGKLYSLAVVPLCQRLFVN